MTIQTWVQTLVLAAAIFWNYATLRKDVDLLLYRIQQLEEKVRTIDAKKP